MMPTALIPPFNLDEICNKRTDKNGNVTYLFARTKAAETTCAKMQLAIEVFDSREDKPEIWYYLDGYWHPGGAQLISYYLDEIAEDLSDSENINDVLRRVRGKLRLKPVEFDITNPYLICCKGGITLDLQTGTTRKSAPMDLISMPIPVKYNSNAKCPEFIKFLHEIAATDDDRLSIIDFLVSLLIAEPMDFFVAAPGLGSNGRSKLKDFIRAFVGSDACRSISLKDLSNRFTSGFLTRCRVNFCNETELSAIILEFIKRSSEKMPVEQKFKGMVNALLYLKYFFDTNIMPSISDTSYGAERRLCRWDLPWRFVDTPDPANQMEKARDPDILVKITTDEELSGVLNLILERAPEVITRKMIHHRDGGLQEYALQSRSGDIFIDLFLSTTISDADKVHTDTIRTAYQKYCVVTNSSMLSSKALKTLIQDKLNRNQEKNVKIDKVNRWGYKSLKLDSDLYEGTIATLEKARTKGKPVFSTLLILFPDLENTNTSVKRYQMLPYATSETAISLLYRSLVVKVAKCNGLGDEESKGADKFPPENTAPKNATFATHATNVATDNENGGSVKQHFDSKGSKNHRLIAEEVVDEFLQDGGRGSLKRFLAEFPEARRPEDAANGL